MRFSPCGTKNRDPMEKNTDPYSAGLT